jgi:oligopeptidase B
MLDPALPLVQRDYEEWGDPRQAADYFAIKRWCPYTNLRPRPYPPVLVTGAMHDSQVMYWEPAKFVARLRGVTTSGQTVLLRVDQTSGHDGPSSSDAWIEHQAFLLAWVLDRCGFFNGRDKTP